MGYWNQLTNLEDSLSSLGQRQKWKQDETDSADLSEIN